MGIESNTELPAGAPLYRHVKFSLLESIQQGEWRPGDAIPSEKRLSERLKVSIGTLRKAVDELTEERVLVRQQGRGTFVALSGSRDFSNAFRRFMPAHAVASPTGSHAVSVKALHKTRARQDEAEDLKLAPDAEVYRIRLQHLLQDQPMAFEQVIVPAHRFPDLDEDLVHRYGGNLYQLYQDTYSTTVLKVQDMVGSEPVDEGIAPLLGCDHNQPIVYVKRVAWSYQDDPVECRHSWIDPRKARYVVTTTD
jgi:GntR family transcriptional regulator